MGRVVAVDGLSYVHRPEWNKSISNSAASWKVKAASMRTDVNLFHDAYPNDCLLFEVEAWWEMKWLRRR
jgi:hypothetical protein